MKRAYSVLDLLLYSINLVGLRSCYRLPSSAHLALHLGFCMSHIKQGRTQINVKLTSELLAVVDEAIAKQSKNQGKEVNRSEFLRMALRYYLDNQDDVVGSRRHFTRQFQQSLGMLRSLLMVILVLLARIGAELTLELTDVERAQLEQADPEKARRALSRLAIQRGRSLISDAMLEVAGEGDSIEDQFWQLTKDREIDRRLHEQLLRRREKETE